MRRLNIWRPTTSSLSVQGTEQYREQRAMELKRESRTIHPEFPIEQEQEHLAVLDSFFNDGMGTNGNGVQPQVAINASETRSTEPRPSFFPFHHQKGGRAALRALLLHSTVCLRWHGHRRESTRNAACSQQAVGWLA